MKLKIKPVHGYVTLFSALFLTRVFLFMPSFGAVEHDSGWVLGLAKNLAMHGSYSSYTNTVDQEEPGIRRSIHGRPALQDKEGRIHFPAATTVGPSYVMPQALLIWLFGEGLWVYRAWPLLTFTALLILSSLLVFELGSWVGVGVFHLWLWSLPQYTIIFVFESLAESICVLFLLLAFVFFRRSIPSVKRERLLFLSGVCASLAFLTKTIGLVFASALGVAALHQLWISQNRPRTAKKMVGFFAGVLTPILLFETYRVGSVISHFGLAGWAAMREDVRLQFLSGGIGYLTQGALPPWDTFKNRANIWLDLNVRLSFFFWALFLLLPLVWIRFGERKQKQLVYLLYACACVGLLWFFQASAGFSRHVWPSTFMTMMLVSGTLGLLSQRREPKGIWPAVAAALFAVFIVPGFFHPKSDFQFRLGESNVARWWSFRADRREQGFPVVNLLSAPEQEAAVKTIRAQLKPADRVYYLGWLLVAEMSPLVEKVFYPLDRYRNLKGINPEGGDSYLILGPYQKGRWSIVGQEYASNKVKAYCERMVFENPSYTFCQLKPMPVPHSPPYQ